MADKVEVYEDAVGEWRWHRKAGNGEILSASSEGYRDRDHAVEQAVALNPDVEVEVREGGA